MSEPTSDALLSQPVVIDNGTGVVKAGLAGGDRPSCVFASAVGRAKHTRIMPGGALEGGGSYNSNDEVSFVGRRVAAHRGALVLSQPMARGMVEDWADMERVWSHVYGDEGLARPPSAHPLLLTEAPLNAARHREKAAEVFFENFGVPALYMAPQAILSLYASGRTTGLVLDVGDGLTQAVPVYEGFAVSHAVSRMDIGGRDVTERLQLLLRRADCVLATSAERDIARQIKERRCYVALEPAKDETTLGALMMNSTAASDSPNSTEAKPVMHSLPDGSRVLLGAERFRAPEVMFSPQHIGSEEGGVHQILAMAALKADMDLRATLFSQIVLAGGSTLFPGFAERLLQELKQKLPFHTKIRIHAPPERALSTWIGGSILASLPSFRNMWVLRSQFEEHGARIFSSRAL